MTEVCDAAPTVNRHKEGFLKRMGHGFMELLRDNMQYSPEREEAAVDRQIARYGIDSFAIVDEGESWETNQFLHEQWGQPTAASPDHPF